MRIFQHHVCFSQSHWRHWAQSMTRQLISASYLFQPVALETLGPINDSAVDFLSELGSRIGTASGEIRERQFLFQRLSVTIQRFNSILLHNSR